MSIIESRSTTRAPVGGEAITGDRDAVWLLFEAMRLRDPALADHGLRAAHLAAAVAVEMGANDDERRQAFTAALLHDVGKLGVREAVLWKEAGLDPSEWSEVRTHPESGHRLVRDALPDEAAAAVLHHHERIDGGGYPAGRRLSTLPTLVAVVAVADAYDAMTSDRPYAPAVSHWSAVAELQRCSGTQFAGEVVDTLATVMTGSAKSSPTTLTIDIT